MHSPMSMSVARLAWHAAAPERLRWRAGEASLAVALRQVEAALSRCDAHEWSRPTILWTGPMRRVVWAAAALDLAESVELLVNAALAHGSAGLLQWAMSLHGPRQQAYWRGAVPGQRWPDVRRVMPADVATAFGAFAGDAECLDAYPWLQHRRTFVGTTALSWGAVPQSAEAPTARSPEVVDALPAGAQDADDPFVTLTGLRALRHAERLLRERDSERQKALLLLSRAAIRVRNSGDARAASVLSLLLDGSGWAAATARQWALEGVKPNGWYESLLCRALTPTAPVQVMTPDDSSSWQFRLLKAGGALPFAWASDESAVGRRLECTAVRGPFECLPTAVGLDGRVLLMLHRIRERP